MYYKNKKELKLKKEEISKQIGVKFSEEDYEELRILAFEQHTKIAILVREIVKKELKKTKSKREQN